MQGALSGFVVLLLAGVGTFVFNRLWQRSLFDEASAAMEAAEALGIRIAPLGFGPEVVARGTVNGTRVRVRWRGGVRGARSDVSLGCRQHHVPLLVSAAALHALVTGEE